MLPKKMQFTFEIKYMTSHSDILNVYTIGGYEKEAPFEFDLPKVDLLVNNDFNNCIFRYFLI